MATPFTVLKPVPVTDLNFVSSNVLENDHPVWSSATNYTIGQRVIVTTGHHKIYEALTANTNKFPPGNPMDWVEVGPTNRWAAFDESGGTFSTKASPLEFAVSGDRADTIALLDVDAASVRVRAFNAIEGTYYDKTTELQDASTLTSWYDYFFTPINRQKELILRDIPPVSASEYTVTLTGGGTVSLGTFAMGQRTEFGFTEYGAKAGIRNYGRTTVDEFGRVQFVRRGFAKTMNVTIFMDRAITDGVHRQLSELRDTAAIYIAAADIYSMLTIYGRFIDFNIDVAYPNHTLCSLDVEGLT